MKKIKKKDFITELLDDDTQSKNANVKAYTFLKHSKNIKMSNERLERIHDCGNILKYAINEEEKTKKLLYTETCNSRFCSRCQKMKSIKNGQKIFTTTNYLKQEKGYEFIFITLTVPNVPGEQLKDELKKINQAIDKLMQRKRYRKEVIKAFITKVEVTYNRKRNDYHPHIHILGAVEKDYFRKSNENYINQEQLLKDWQECTNDKTINQVNIQAIKGKDDKTLMKSILEISKYEGKSSDFTVNQVVFDTFYHALNGARLIRYNREYKDLVAIYEIDKFGLFNDYKMEIDENGNFTSKLIALWNFKDKEYKKYFEDLTPEEIAFINRKQEYDSYYLFKKKMKKLQSESLEYGAKLRDYENRLKRQLESNKTRKSSISNTKEKINKFKRYYRDSKKLYSLYEIIDTDFKDKFMKAK